MPTNDVFGFQTTDRYFIQLARIIGQCLLCKRLPNSIIVSYGYPRHRYIFLSFLFASNVLDIFEGHTYVKNMSPFRWIYERQKPIFGVFTVAGLFVAFLSAQPLYGRRVHHLASQSIPTIQIATSFVVIRSLFEMKWNGTTLYSVDVFLFGIEERTTVMVYISLILLHWKWNRNGVTHKQHQ